MTKVLVSGALGKMGEQVVSAVLAAPDLELAGGFDPKASSGAFDWPLFTDLNEAIEATNPDVLVDFSLPAVVESNLKVALARGVNCVVGTTGLKPATLEALAAIATKDAALFVAPNFMLGAVLMERFAVQAATYFEDVEIVEFHHNNKADSPSGTALNTARAVASARFAAAVTSKAPGKETEQPGCEGARGAFVEGVPVHSVRSNGFLAHQEVLLGSGGETLTIRHDSIDRSAYMPGVLLAIRAVDRLSGLVVGLDKLLDI
jgi:4-hydroxy-tetrahydrodipicolinate reductase